MDYKQTVNTVLHWNYRGLTEFPLHSLQGEEAEITDIYLKENLISRIPSDIGKLNNLESLYLSGNDITELPREISKLRRLKCLDLSGNRLQYIPDEIGEMRSLKFLILDENELRQLPLRIAELRLLRYFSVCDNKLRWLPQRPVYNYHHCEFRFWRNRSLSTIPYSLWYHMFRGQQTRSLNIGCLSITKCENTFDNGSFVLQISQNLDECGREISVPTKYGNTPDKNIAIVPNLMELCKRRFYDMLDNASKKLTTAPTSIYSDVLYEEKFENNNYINNLQECFQGFNLKKGLYDLNNMNENIVNDNPKLDTNLDTLLFKNKLKGYCVPSDIVEEYFYYLPTFIKRDLCCGPSSRCENLDCKQPIFDFVYFEFCLEKIILIDHTEDIILSAEFCSKSCAEKWKAGKNILFWKLS